MPKIVIDPVTRIEGHLRIEAQVERGRIVDAWSSGGMFRGIELISAGRDPREAWLFTQRICGACSTVHATASVRAVENALRIVIPDNARIIRNLITAGQYIQDHVTHFYHQHALDWMDAASALKADPSRTSSLATSLSDRPLSSTAYFKGVQQKIKALLDSGQPGILANGYWGHKAYKLPPEANLLVMARYWEALEWRRDFIRMQALLSAKNPHAQTYLVGGMSIPVDPKSQHALNEGSIEFLREQARQAMDFVETVYLPDLLLVASFYKEWSSFGGGAGNYLACGEFPNDGLPDTENLWLPRGIIRNRDLGTVHPFDQERIMEYVTHSWYRHSSGDVAPRHPYDGETNPEYSGPKPPYQHLDTDRKYSWVKAPRYDGQPMETGPLARMLVAYASGHKRAKESLDTVLERLDLGPEALFSTLGRMAARGVEALITAEMMLMWIDQLAANMREREIAVHNGEKRDPASWPNEARGYGFHEAPRGFLGHWIRIKDQKISHYQCVSPDTWNGSPRDAGGQRGPYEAALMNTPIADPERPIEVLRTIHSFAPCMACAAH